MWAQYPDQYGNLQWSMIPYYYSYFTQFLQLVATLRETLNKKWRPDQIKAYNTYLNDL